jgi:uncharacterized protein (DUF2141 family)
MRRILTQRLGVILIASTLWSAPVNAGDEGLAVRIHGISAPEGLLMVALENEAGAYDNGPLEKAAYRGEVVKAEATSMTVIFPGIPQGTYAVKAFHDANGNLTLDKNLFGIPTENYGFSNNARGTFGPARFEDARFTYAGGNMIVEIGLK